METAISTLSVLPSNRDQIRSFSRQLKDEILSGNTDPLKALVQLKFIEKMLEDILKDEELDRLGSHIGEIRRVLRQREPVGRRLDFLLQEFNREANTLGSKSVDSRTSNAAVELKVLIDQIREQVQNLE